MTPTIRSLRRLALALSLLAPIPAGAVSFTSGPFAGTIASVGGGAQIDFQGALVGQDSWQVMGVGYEVSAITFDFDDALPLVSVSSFTVDLDSISGAATVPFGISRTFDFTVTTSPVEISFPSFDGPYTLVGSGQPFLPPGSVRIPLLYGIGDQCLTVSFGTPFGPVGTEPACAQWAAYLRFGTTDVLNAPLFLEQLGYASIPSAQFIATDPVSGEPIGVTLNAPLPIEVGQLQVVPEPGSGLLVALGAGLSMCWRRRARPVSHFFAGCGAERGLSKRAGGEGGPDGGVAPAP